MLTCVLLVYIIVCVFGTNQNNFFLSSSLVQSVERRTVNPYVTGPSPVGGARRKKNFLSSSLVQSVERRTVNPYVTGPSPVGGAKKAMQPYGCFFLP